MDPTLLALMAALAACLVVAALINQWHQQQTLKQKKLRQLQRDIDHVVTTAQLADRFMETGALRALLLQIGANGYRQMARLSRHSDGEAQAAQLEDKARNLAGSTREAPQYVLRNDVEVSHAKKLLQEAVQLIGAAVDLGLTEPEQGKQLTQDCQWAALQVEVRSQMQRGEQAAEEKRLPLARRHYKQALNVLKQSHLDNPVRLEQIKACSAMIKELEARSVSRDSGAPAQS